MKNKYWCDICEEETESKTVMIGDSIASIYICQKHKLALQKAHLISKYLWLRLGAERINSRYVKKGN